MIDTDDSPEAADDLIPNASQDARPWSALAEQARRELEAWARSRPREHHRAERLRATQQPAPQP